MEFNSDDSWEPEPCNTSSDLLYEEGSEEHKDKTHDASFYSQHSSPESSRFSGQLTKKCHMPEGFGGTSCIPMSTRVNSERTTAGPAISGDELCNIKRPKQGMHGNQVRMPNHLQLQLFYLRKLCHAGSKESSRSPSSKMELRGQESGVGLSLIPIVSCVW